MTVMKNCAVLLAGVGAVTAIVLSDRAGINIDALLGGVSETCKAALLGIASDRESSSCLNLPGLTAVITLQANFSAVPSLNNWLEGFCRADPCSNDTINAIANNITSGCLVDIPKDDVSQNILQTVLQDVPKFYPTVRNIACLKTTSNDTLCATSTLLDIQRLIGQPLTATSAIAKVPSIVAQESSLANLTCTGCTLAAFNTLKMNQAMLAENSVVQDSLLQTCGAGFLNTSQPVDVVDGTGSAAPTGSIAANTLPSHSGAAPVGLTLGNVLGIIASAVISVLATVPLA